MKITRMDVMDALRDLEGAFTPPKGVTRDVLASVWMKVLDGVYVDELNRSVDQYLRSDARYWPKPGLILGEIRKARHLSGIKRIETAVDVYWAWEETKGDGEPLAGAGSACPVCGAVLEYREPSGRYNVWHNASLHESAGVPFVGPRSESLSNEAAA